MFSDTQPAPLDLAGDASLSDFRITDAVEIRALLKALTGFLAPTEGEFSVLGERYGTSDWRELRLKIGVVTSAFAASIPLSEVANHERPLPDNFITADGMFVTNAFLDYAPGTVLGFSEVPFSARVKKLARLGTRGTSSSRMSVVVSSTRRRFSIG